ncbi:unnamed protein product [Didymodactylos carnosus]|uniref:Uncharacterized protein n=1 Tax=Didymodactylos carnosus TaxID=1234261 RepID=A0A8S2F8S0_9BILA|nr:unnamed protein product [Didymodactylos carnosus]CAF4201637.1 unnamed protein product [Didymodactylos carnosus]
MLIFFQGDKGYCYIPYEYMCNPELCADFFSIKTVTDDQRHSKQQETQNSSDSNTHKNTPVDVPSNHTDEYFDDEWSIEKVPPNSDLSYILWMDNDKADIAQITKHLTSDPSVHVNFQETFDLATKYLLQHMDKIKSLPQSTIFQIICRGYYKSEDKNPLNLLLFLDHYQLKNVPIIVFTQDKPGVLNSFEREAPSMGIHDWKYRLYVTDNSADLITKINANASNKSVSQRH